MKKKTIEPGTALSRDIVCTTHAVSEQHRTIDYVASNQNVDRYRTRLKGWLLDNYRKCPVVLFGHNKHMPPIGRALDVRQGEDGNLHVRIQFAPKETYEFADTCYKLIRDGYMPGISVGFSPTRTEYDEENEVMDLLDNELFELSSVPVPGNPDTLANAMRDGVIPEQYRDFFVYNRSAAITGIEGVDMDELRALVEEWHKSAFPEIDEESVEPTPIDTVPEPEITQPVADVVLRSIGDSYYEREKQLLADLDVAMRGMHSAQNALRTIAALVDFDIAKLSGDDHRSYAELCSLVQDSIIRAGAVLSRKNRDALKQAVDLIEVVLEGAAPSGDAKEDSVDEEGTLDAPPAEQRSDDSDTLAAIQEQIARLTATVEIVAGAQAGRSIVADSKPTSNPLDMILSRMNAVSAK